MFTGIIKRVSKVADVKEKRGSLFVKVEKPKDWKVKLGESIAINGVCSTVKGFDQKVFEVEYMPETLKKTTVGNYKKGAVVNLEKSMGLNDLLDGHIVQCHVDTRGTVIEIKPVKDSVIMKIRIPAKFMRLVAEKGSVAVDGISLTVVQTGKDWFTVSLVSYTLEHTNLGQVKKGTQVNVETDVLAKYLDKLLKSRKK